VPKGVYKRVKPPWSKGLTKDTDQRIAKLAEKVSASRLGIPLSEYARQKIREAMNRPEVKEKLRLKALLRHGHTEPLPPKRYKRSEEVRQKIAQHYGRLANHLDEIVNLRLNGMKYADIGSIYDVHPAAIIAYLRRAGVFDKIPRMCIGSCKGKPKLNRNINAKNTQIQCELCGSQIIIRGFPRHLRDVHHIETADEYYKKAMIPPRLCQCGCGNAVFPGRDYIQGHLPKDLLREQGIKARKAIALNCPTSIEKILYSLLDQKRQQYIPQHRIGPYVVDAYIPSSFAVVEAWGDYWHTLPGAPERDIKRIEYFRQLGCRFAALWGSELQDDPEGCKRKLHQVISGKEVELWTAKS